MLNKIKNSKLDNEKLKGCQLVNNDELEGFDFSKAIVKKPWGCEYLAYKEGVVSVWILKINKDAATSMHCHLNKKTALVLLSGQAVSTTLNSNFFLNEGDGLILDKKVFHSTKALSDHIILMEVEVPSFKTDLVRLYDHYGRELKGYELQDEMLFDLEKYNPIFFSESEEKRIGKMYISIKYFQDDHSLRDYLKSSEIILLLSGELFNQKIKKCFKMGDIFEVDNPGGMFDIKIKKPVKILKIVKYEKD